jgi:chaperonin GroEL
LRDQYHASGDGYKKIADADPAHVLGKVSEVKIDKKSTLLRGAEDDPSISEKVEERICYLENYMMDNIMLGDFEQEQIEERIGKLRGGLCIVKAGGLSEVEISECRDRIEDSLFAVRAALEDGFVIGGGLALLNASRDLDLSDCTHFEKTGF